MFTIDNMTVKEFIKDRTYLYFKPLLCCMNISRPKNQQHCEYCRIDIFTDSIIETLQSHHFEAFAIPNYRVEVSPKIETFNVLYGSPFDIIRKEYA